MAIAFQLCSNAQWEINVSCSTMMFGLYADVNVRQVTDRSILSQCITSLEHVPISFKVFHVNKMSFSLKCSEVYNPKCLDSLSTHTQCSKLSNYAILQFLAYYA